MRERQLGFPHVRQRYDYNTGYGTSGAVAYGTYPDCSSGDSYREHGSHWRNGFAEGGQGDNLAH